MDNVLTLIANPEARNLSDSMADVARAALKALGAETGAPDWLDPAIACDIAFDGLAPDQADAAARQALNRDQRQGATGIDLIAQPAEHRRKRLLIADMESTIIQQEMLDELGDFVGMKDHIARITHRAMNGEIDFAGAVRERVALLAALPVSALDEIAVRMTLMPGALALVRTMRANGAHCMLVSGGFKSFTTRVRAWVGFDEDQANDLEIAAGRLTGRPVEPILDKDAKLAALMRTAGGHHIPIKETIAVGDGANDLPMLQAAGLGVAYHAKPVVAAAARARVDHADLTALLYAQGYRGKEIRAAMT